MELAGRMNFPWLMSNVYWKKSGRLLANGLKKHVLTWQGRKVRDRGCRCVVCEEGVACEEEGHVSGKRSTRVLWCVEVLWCML